MNLDDKLSKTNSMSKLKLNLKNLKNFMIVQVQVGYAKGNQKIRKIRKIQKIQKNHQKHQLVGTF